LRKIIINGRLVTPLELLDGSNLIIEDGKITAIISDYKPKPGSQDEIIDADGLWATPGLIDIHVHGCNRVDTMDASHQTWRTMGHFFAKHGVTSYLPTTGTAPKEQIQAVIDNLASFCYTGEGAVPLGLHLEGPYLNAARKGAQPEEYLAAPDPHDYRRWFDSGLVKVMTVAPELDGAMELIQYGIEQGVKFAAGHTTASYGQMEQAVENGLDQAAHLYNGMDPLHHRYPGVVGAVLSDERIYAQIIADGVHVHPAVVRLTLKTKGLDRMVLITDAMRAAGLEDGVYDLLGQPVTVKSGEARVTSGSLAGSVLTMDAALRNMIEFCGITLPEAVHMASYVPARALGLQGKGQLSVGADADITLLNEELTVEKTLVRGTVVFDRKNA